MYNVCVTVSTCERSSAYKGDNLFTLSSLLSSGFGSDLCENRRVGDHMSAMLLLLLQPLLLPATTATATAAAVTAAVAF